MRISYGNGGWVRVDGIGLPGPLHIRFTADEQGRWRAAELYLDGDDQPLSTSVLRELRLDRLEAAVLEDRDHLRARSGIPGPDLHRLAAFYGTTWGSYDGQHCETCGGPVQGGIASRRLGRTVALNWVVQSWFAQLPGSGIRQVRLPKQPSPSGEFEELPAIEPPSGRRMTEDFLREVARVYALAAQLGLPPAPAIAEKAGVSPRAVHKWIYTARKRGFMPPGTRGRVG
jgi:hypothetical protein